MPARPILFGGLRIGLAPKLVSLLVASTIVLFALFGYLNLHFQQRNAEEIILQDGDHVGDLIVRGLRHHMMQNDREALHQAISDLGMQPGIRRIRVLNSSGRIDFSTEPNDVDNVVDKRAASCQDCHVSNGPPQVPLRLHDARFYVDGQGQRALTVFRAVENEPGCANASCHSHPPDQRILGMVDVSLSLATVSRQIAVQKAELVGFSVVAVVVFSCISALFIWKVVDNPMKKLLSGIQRVAAGHVTDRLEVRTHDEFGELACSFNRMTENLDQAQQENTAWGKTLEQRVEAKTRELEGAQRILFEREKMASIGKLAATVAHEVNNPLAGILTYAKLTLKKLQNPAYDAAARAEMQENLRTIERESRRCGDLMRNLLMFARKAPSRQERNDLNELVRSGLVLVQHHLDLQGIALKLELSEELPLTPCDAGQIRQVILAILVNATEAMPRGGSLRIATSRDVDKDTVLLRVRDSGPGIATDIASHIFDPFFTTKEGQQNTGLGLAVARSILEQHGGAISVSSAVGEGTEFVVSLPVHESASIEDLTVGQQTR